MCFLDLMHTSITIPLPSSNLQQKSISKGLFVFETAIRFLYGIQQSIEFGSIKTAHFFLFISYPQFCFLSNSYNHNKSGFHEYEEVLSAYYTLTNDFKHD